jgi:WD40 repeat protein
LLASGSEDKSIRIWNAREGKLMREIPQAHVGAVKDLVFSTADPSTLLASASNSVDFDLGVDYEDLSEGGKPAMAVQLIMSCQRRSLLQKLREFCQCQRPAMDW